MTVTSVVVEKRAIRHTPKTPLYVIEDLTEKKHMEQQLLQAERMSLLGQMAPRIAHELKTPLQVIIGSADLAKIALASHDTDMLNAWLDKVPDGALPIRGLVDQMMNLGKPKKPEWRPVVIQEEIPKLAESLEPIGLLKYFEVSVDLSPGLAPVMGDPTEIDQVFRNLIVNAVHAMESHSRGHLRITAAPSDDGETIAVRVEDTGCGIDPEHLDGIFEPFFTTKPEGKGTGLGLPIVRSIVERHRGTIEVDSTKGAGTTFTVTFPTHAG